MILIELFPMQEKVLYEQCLTEKLFISVAKDCHGKIVEDLLGVYAREKITAKEIEIFFNSYNKLRNNFNSAAETIFKDSKYVADIGIYTIYVYRKLDEKYSLVAAEREADKQIYQEKLQELKKLILNFKVPVSIFETMLSDKEPEVLEHKPIKPKKEPKPKKVKIKNESYSLF